VEGIICRNGKIDRMEKMRKQGSIRSQPESKNGFPKKAVSASGTGILS
jgi:hypothetical protein